jgi:hypothetical protein
VGFLRLHSRFSEGRILGPAIYSRYTVSFELTITIFAMFAKSRGPFIFLIEYHHFLLRWKMRLKFLRLYRRGTRRK